MLIKLMPVKALKVVVVKSEPFQIRVTEALAILPINPAALVKTEIGDAVVATRFAICWLIE